MFTFCPSSTVRAEGHQKNMACLAKEEASMIDLDREEYKHIRIYTMKDNKSILPIYVRRFCDKDEPTGLHRHEMIQINYVMKGQLLHQINQMTFPVTKGDVFVIPPYIPHRLIPDSGHPFEIVELEFETEFLFGSPCDTNMKINDFKSLFNFAYIEPFLVSEGEVKPRLNLTGKAQLTTENLLTVIEEEYKAQSESYILAIKALLLQLLVLLGRCFSQVIQTNEKQLYLRHQQALEDSLQYIETHSTEPISVESVSKVALLSPSYFSYLFKAMTGKTFIEHLTSIRIRQAMELLRTTDNFVLDICLDVGFNNINHFNRTFKMSTGISPLQYRKTFYENPKE